jgi:hypothetical protein
MLPVTTFQNRTPVTFFVFLEASDNPFHLSLAGGRTYPLLVRWLEVGRHQRMMESVIRKQTPEATMSGSNTE